MDMQPDDFDFISKLIKSRSGLVLTPDKVYLLESRLMPVARKRGIKGLAELIALMRTRPDERLAAEMTEAMTTNESFFFRDTKPFDQLRDIVLPHILRARAARRRLRIWCAAASSGQEPYSICMVLKELGAKVAGWKIDIVGTDLSNEILEKARNGLYTQFEVQRGLPVQLLVKYFEKKDDMWQISSELRHMVQYRTFNLLHDMRSLGQFDIVFCRNVLIYFDQPTKADVLARIAAQMPDDGFLHLGGAETVLGISEKFRSLGAQRGIYQLNRPGAPKIDAGAPVSSSRPAPGHRGFSRTATAPAVTARPGGRDPVRPIFKRLSDGD